MSVSDEPKWKPRLRAEGTGVIVMMGERTSLGSVILVSCRGSPMRRNSVLDGFRASRFEVIQVETEVIADSSC